MGKLKIGADSWAYKPSWRIGCSRWWKDLVKLPERVVRHKIERAQNGYSWADWINFDSYIAGVVATAVLKFAEDGVGFFPMADEQMNEDFSYDNSVCENFYASCGAIYYALTEWLNWDLVDQVKAHGGDHKATYAAEQIVYGEAREAMIMFAENLGSWWD